ncbi:LacI family DNA-binding transcriptional regulator [Thioclava kandeliae]|uniref:LacI family DNA-binding transcriptional regulator n=1 Tax=Thioclava kandeliae TaxID=3070818 RepID=A0ABV1SL71_9RHOB
MAHRITIPRLAQAAGVSASTVDRILNGRGAVQKATREHVLAVAEAIGFHGVPVLRRRAAEGAGTKRLGFVLPQGNGLYRDIGAALSEAAQICARPELRYYDETDPATAAIILQELAQSCDALGVMCPDDPVLVQTLGELAQRQVPVWTLLSDLPQAARAGFVGLDAFRLGRSAGWFMERLLPQGGKVAVICGASGFAAQSDCAAGFAACLAGRGMDLVSRLDCGESDATCRNRLYRLLGQQPDIRGLYVIGAGMAGAIGALKLLDRPDIAVIGTYRDPYVAAAMAQGWVDVVLSHSFEGLARAAVARMVLPIGHTGAPVMAHLPQEILISEGL